LTVFVFSTVACNFEKQEKTTPSIQEEVAPSSEEVTLHDTLPDEVGKVYKIVEEMPSFSGCDNLATPQERKKCSDQDILKFIYNNFKYPKEAKQKGIHQKIIVRFIIDEIGNVNDVTTLHNLDNSLGNEAIRVIKSMPTWTPGKHKGKPVKVEVTIPINIKPEQN